MPRATSGESAPVAWRHQILDNGTGIEVSLSERDRKLLEDLRNVLFEFINIERDLMKMSERFTELKWKEQTEEFELSND